MSVSSRRFLPLILSTSLLFAAPGCVSVWHFEDLEARVAAVEGELKAMQERQKEDQERLGKLHADMVDAEETLRLNGASLGVDVDRLKKDVARLQGTDEEMLFAISKNTTELRNIRKTLGDRLGITVMDLPEGLTDNPDALMEAAQKAFDAGEDRKAAELAEIASTRYPASLTSAKAIFLLAEIAFKAGNLGKATTEYYRVYNDHKDVSGAPLTLSLLRIGEIFEKQSACRKAIEIYDFLVTNHKKSAEAKTATERIKKLKKSCK